VGPLSPKFLPSVLPCLAMPSADRVNAMIDSLIRRELV